MKLEVFNRSKFRDGSAPGDDVPLALPGVIYGVFDGATDPLGTVVNGLATGRLAAMTTASEMVKIALDPDARVGPADQIIARLSCVLKARTDPLNLQIPPSTTLAVVLECGDKWRFILLGDSAVRINGTEVVRHEKIIDAVSTVARVALFTDLQHQHDDPDTIEALARRGIFLGLEIAIQEGVTTRARAEAIVAQAVAANTLQQDGDTVKAFLMGGLQRQFTFANTVGNSLCFDTLNGTMPQLQQLQEFERDKRDITSIEIFSDGYPSLPAVPSVAAWEAAFRSAETEDFSKIGRYAAVKGSTTTQFHDDRSVVILR